MPLQILKREILTDKGWKEINEEEFRSCKKDAVDIKYDIKAIDFDDKTVTVQITEEITKKEDLIAGIVIISPWMMKPFVEIETEELKKHLSN